MTMTMTIDAMNTTTPAAAVDAAIMSYFLQHGRACTIKELAEHMSRSERWLRKVMSDNHGCTRGSVVVDESRESFSKSYPGMQMGYHRVTCYQPTMASMRAAILAK